MGAILKRELSSYFNSAIAYVVLAAYFFFSGVNPLTDFINAIFLVISG